MKTSLDTIRSQFPLIEHLRKRHAVYLDSASTSQKPLTVIDSISSYYKTLNANPRRGVSAMSYQVSERIEATRAKISAFVGARNLSEIVFTKNTTEALNLVAFGYGRQVLKKGDQIVLSRMEHHSNLVPWQEVAKKTGATLKYIDVDARGELDLAQYESLLSAKTKIVAITHVSNVFGSITPLKSIIASAHRVGAVVVVDGAQVVPHMKLDVVALGADFYAFSGHKMYAPNGIGVLYGKADLLEQTKPLLYGGGMIEEVSDRASTYDNVPHRFEAGTVDAAAILGLEQAIEFMQSIGFDAIAQHENSVLKYAREKIARLPNVETYWPRNMNHHSAVISCNIRGIHPHDTATVLDELGVVVRAGHHCAMPLMRHLKRSGTVRLSLGLYNTTSDIDRACEALEQAQTRFV